MRQERACVYSRVSTRDKDQNPERQAREMRQFCAARKWKVMELVDQMSGYRNDRPQWQELWKLCRQRKVDIVVVHEYSRFSRSVIELVRSLHEFNALGIQFVSVKEGIDTTTPAGKLVFTVIAGMAEFGRDIIRENVKSGMALKKALLKEQGFFISKKGHRRTALGRPRAAVSVEYIARRREQNATWTTIAAELDVSPDTCQRAVLNAAKGSFPAQL